MSVGAVNKSTGDRIPTAGMPAIDNALSAISTNPVQNAIITAALANKQDKTDSSLQTTDKTIVGAINEHEDDIDSLKSGLTNKIPVEAGYIPPQDSYEITLAAGCMYAITCARYGVVDFSILYTDSSNISVTHINTSQELTFTTSGRSLTIANASSVGYRVSTLKIFWG